jgi:hypothetical protein
MLRACADGVIEQLSRQHAPIAAMHPPLPRWVIRVVAGPCRSLADFRNAPKDGVIGRRSLLIAEDLGCCASG